MKAAQPVPGEQWPHGMLIAVEDRPTVLLELLWIREAYALQPQGADLPPPLVSRPAAATELTLSPATRATWDAAWPVIWDAAAEHAGAPPLGPDVFDRIQNTPGGPERAALLRGVVGPSWRDEFGNAALEDPSYREWSRQGDEAHAASHARGIRDDIIRQAVRALVPAWRAGLTTIVTIPCRGEHTRRLGSHGLLMTDETRSDLAALERALRTFG